MSKSILTIGLELASSEVMHENFDCKASLLDWDIVLFRPEINGFLYGSETYQGKPLLSDTASFKLKESCEHWRREIKQAVDAGKTVIVFLAPAIEVFIDTGQRTYSGTGRNRKTTRLVAEYSNYSALPTIIDPIKSTGSSIKLVSQVSGVLAPYWTEFGSVSRYNLIFGANVKGICLTTKTGEKPVGAIIRSKDSPGSLVLLPDIDFAPSEFIVVEEYRRTWNVAAQQFAARMISAVVNLDKALRSYTEITSEPKWASNREYVLVKEDNLRSELLDAERQVEGAQKRKESILEDLKDSGRLRALLYEKGKSLEYAIIDALKILGFQAAQYKEEDSEFDVVFESAEGRLLGEAEGKDTKAINIDKLRQLSMNIHEDLQREEVSSPAKGVLFGNGYRFTPPRNRDTQFTEKCMIAASSSSIALIATSDLFTAARYISNQPDDNYAKRCREAMLTGNGAVLLPSPPVIDQTEFTDLSITQ